MADGDQRKPKAVPAGRGRSEDEARQKRLLFGLLAAVGLLALAAVLWAVLGGAGASASRSGQAEGGAAEDGAEGAADTEPAVPVEGLGEDWDARVAEAEAAVDALRLRLREDPSLAEDSVMGRLMGKSMAGLAEAKREASVGDPVRARKAVREVTESKEAVDAYLEAKEALAEVVERYEAARAMAVEHRLQAFQPELYKEALALRQEAEAATAGGDAEAASAKYEEAIGRFEAGKAAFDATIGAAREAAAAAFADGDRAAGEAAVARILERLPEDAAGLQWRERMAVLDETHPLFTKAESNATNDLLSVAEGQYRSVIEKDPHHAAAKEGLERVVAARAAAVAEARLTEAEAAAAAGELGEALDLVEQALALTPESERAKRLAQDVRERADRQRMADSLGTAKRLEAEGKWDAALELYAGLAADFPGLKDAADGLDRAKQGRRDAFEADELYKAAKEAFNRSSVADLEYGIGLLEKARRLNPRNDEVATLLAATRERLKLMNQPVSVTLVSDGETQIEVWKVGVFKEVTSKELKLKPGSYTVVGKRPYYFDVKLDLTVPAGGEPMRFPVKCDQPL
ncbi:MAG: hypothetical protein GVY36_14660 [Verrucomicrobia bacterium]|jgi:hypothetical protein|nr:hypothetical protein [Verrucomicrobiota bacterium]